METSNIFNMETSIGDNSSEITALLNGFKSLFTKEEQQRKDEHNKYSKTLSEYSHSIESADKFNIDQLKKLHNQRFKLTEIEFKKRETLLNSQNTFLIEYRNSNKNLKNLSQTFENYSKSINKTIENLSSTDPLDKLSGVIKTLSESKLISGQGFDTNQQKQLSETFNGAMKLFNKQFEKSAKEQTEQLEDAVLNVREEKNNAKKGKNKAKKKDSWLFNFQGKLENTIGKVGNTIGSKAAGIAGKGADWIGKSKVPGAGFVGKGLSNAADIVKTDFDTAKEDTQIDEDKTKMEANKDISKYDEKLQNAKTSLTKNEEYQLDILEGQQAFEESKVKYEEVLSKDWDFTNMSLEERKEAENAYQSEVARVTDNLMIAQTNLANGYQKLKQNSGNQVNIDNNNEEIKASGFGVETPNLDEYITTSRNTAQREYNNANVVNQFTEEQISSNTLKDVPEVTSLMGSLIENFKSEDIFEGVVSNFGVYFEEISNKISIIIEQMGGTTPTPSSDISSGFKFVPPSDDTVQLANGGVIPGNNTEGDKVPALVNSGEMILNNDQQANLFNMIGAQHFEDGGIAGANVGGIKSEEQLDTLNTYEQEYTTVYQEQSQQRMETDQQVADFRMNLQQTELSNKQQANQQEMAMTNKMTMMEKASALKEKAILVGQAIATTASSIGKAFAIGQVDPFAINASIQAGIAAIVGGAQIAAIVGTGFESGGVVPGESYTGDKVIAKVNSGEVILNTNQQENLLKAIDNAEQFAGGGVAGGDSSKILDVASKGQDASKQSVDSIDKLVELQQEQIKETKNVINTIKANKPTLVTKMPGKSFPSVRYTLDYSNY